MNWQSCPPQGEGSRLLSPWCPPVLTSELSGHLVKLWQGTLTIPRMACGVIIEGQVWV